MDSTGMGVFIVGYSAYLIIWAIGWSDIFNGRCLDMATGLGSYDDHHGRVEYGTRSREDIL